MCEGFGGFYHKSGKVYFCEPDGDSDCSHHKTVGRLPKGIDENDLVPFQVPDWKKSKFEWDTVCKPDWANESAKKICLEKLAEVKPIWAEYQKVRDAALAEYQKVCYAAWAEYQKVCDAALAEYEKVRDAAWAEYQKVCAPALAEYQKVCDAAWAEYQKVCDATWAEYEKVRDAAWAEYEKVCDAAWAEYQKVCDAALKVCDAALAEMIEPLKRIDGYCK